MFFAGLNTLSATPPQAMQTLSCRHMLLITLLQPRARRPRLQRQCHSLRLDMKKRVSNSTQKSNREQAHPKKQVDTSHEEIDRVTIPKLWLNSCSTARNNVQLENSKQKGRYLIAKRDIKQGELIAKATPYALTANQSRCKTVCDNCRFYNLENIEQQLPHQCDTCQEVAYCSEQCKEKSSTLHEVECSMFSKLKASFDSSVMKSEKKRNQLLCLGKILVRILCKKELESQQPQDANLSNNNEDSDTDSPSHTFRFSDVLMLCSNMDELPKKKLELLQKVSQIVYDVLEPKYKKEFSKDDILQLACTEESNAFGLYYPLKDSKDNFIESSEARLFAFGFYPLISLCNHSCSPNIFKVLKGEVYYYYALHDIPQGSELCHSYIDLDKNTNQRRQELENNYGFYCICDRCESDSMDDPFLDNYVCSKYGCGGLIIKKQGKGNQVIRVCHKCGAVKEDEDD